MRAITYARVATTDQKQGNSPLDIQEQSRVPTRPPGDRSFQALRTEAERQIVAAALDRNQWHVTRTAEELGLADHSSLLKIMRRLDLRRE